ncbi:GNAT family N-acetyltransferase [Brevibacterium yomogidense]|uniref:N-acetyltransferase domain-containing protein n=1 Tax=Brevibacterium yomogidense TaxID=946573 RepID=A0A1X6X549_9MICO|nr:GNAT family N-acetyltransferase [Brevibacterium yomogidense]SLM94186.1 hypothetical protein FM105_04005 [Brevibacterium yomogidense]
MAPSTPEKPRMTGSVAIRPWRDGDDRALAQVLPDPGSPAQLAARALLREPGESPLTRTLVAVVDSVVVGAAAIAASPAHPGRAWIHVEVAPEERRSGVGSALLEAAAAEASGTALDGLGLRTRIVAGDPETGAFAHARGFADLFTTRIILIDAGALGAAGLERAEDLQVIDTGSVALTQAFAGWYERVNELDPAAPMSIGQVNTRFLSEAAGAHGAALWRPDVDGGGADINKRPVTAFAVSYAQKPSEDAEVQAAEASVVPEDDDHVFALSGGEDATELTIGSVDGEVQDLRSLVARLSVDTPVVVEVTDAMETESALVEELLASGSARILTAYTTLVRDPQG